MRSILPPVKIHAWGGLGSQLFAVALAHDLSQKFRRRGLQVVLHTGGVTRRVPEILDLFPSIQYRFHDDFKIGVHKVSGGKETSGWNSIILLKIKRLLIRCHFVALCNNDEETLRVRPWTVAIRGHYSYRRIGKDFLYMLRDSLPMNTLSESQLSVCSIHYRLGDLLSVEGKSPISAEDIRLEYFRVNETKKFSQTFVYSDSSIEAKLRISNFVAQNLYTPEVKTLTVIVNSIQSSYFIGTSSKISFWIASVRAICFGKESSLPKKNLSQYIGLFQDQINLVFPYEAD